MNRFKEFVLKHFELSLIVLVFLGVIGIGLLIEYKLAFLNFFFLPVILSGHFMGKKQGVLTALFSILVVIFYLIFTGRFVRGSDVLSMNELINLLSWGGFLLLTGAIVGTASEQKEKRMEKLRAAYIGILEILFKYLEYGDKEQPSSVRISLLAGKIAEAAGMETMEVENIKSAALLSESKGLQKSLPFFDELSGYWSKEGKTSQSSLNDREKVILKSTASLLEETQPLLEDYYNHYVRQPTDLDKDLESIHLGSSIIALANIYENISRKAPPFMGVQEFGSINSVKNLGGRTFPELAVQAFILVVSQE
ncbi:MAG: hypothetical protein GF421_07755 [Candidatus Aminicenantes bacterium]|nr:hypothetical protein [Candidatus Aminicenantes bacterium]